MFFRIITQFSDKFEQFRFQFSWITTHLDFPLVIGIYLITRAAFATFKVIISEGGHTYLVCCQVIFN